MTVAMGSAPLQAPVWGTSHGSGYFWSQGDSGPNLYLVQKWRRDPSRCDLGCCLIPCLINDFKDVTHTCPSCKAYIYTYKRLC